MKPDIEDKRNVPRGSWECREGHLNPEKESSCKECERRKHIFPREQDAVRHVPKVDLGNEGVMRGKKSFGIA